MSVAIGIDLGTTNTVVAAVVDGVAVTLEDDKGRRLLPSVVSFQPNGAVLVGEIARERRLNDPESTIFSVKPLLGRPWDSPETQAARQRFPFKLQQGAKNATMVEARGTIYALPEISAFVLRRAKAIAEAALQQPIERAVITVPANFNDLQRASTKIAGKLAGLDVMRILNEPTAAALAYGQSIKAAEKIAVYDLGGGTFDITLLDLTNSVFEVLATGGDTALGGDDVDRVIADRIIKDVHTKLKLDPRGNPASIARIAFLAEEIKKELSSVERFERELSGVAHKSNGAPMSIPFRLTRAELEQLAAPLLERTVTVAQQSMSSVGLTPADFERIILVGGATRMPLVARVVEGLFGKAPALRVNPDEVVALGAAIQAHALNRSKAAHKAPAKPPPVPKKPPPPPSQPKLEPQAAPPKPPPSSQRLPPYRPSSSSKMPAVRPASTPRMGAVKPPSHPAMAKVVAAKKPPSSPDMTAPKPPPVPPPRPSTKMAAAKPAEPAAPPPVPAPTKSEPEFFSFSKGTATISWDLPGDAKPAPPPAPAPAPVPAAAPLVVRPPTPIDELDVPDLDLDMPSAPVGPTDIVAAPPELDFGLDLPSASAAPEPPAFDMLEPLEPQAPAASFGQFGELDLSNLAGERFQQGSAIATSAHTPLLIDVTPLSLGVETAGGYADVLIPANSPVPCEKTRTFLTANDGQTSVTVRVAQGESPKFAGNTRLGDVELSGLRRAYRGEVKIAVTFELDADGILNVRARDPDTGQETVATMRLVGATAEAEDLGIMAERQARHHVQ